VILLASSSFLGLGAPAFSSETAANPLVIYDGNILATDLMHAQLGQRLAEYDLRLDPKPLSKVSSTTREGYSFGGWSYVAGGEPTLTLETASWTSNRVNLYAVWVTKVNLEGNGATKGSPEPTNYRFGQDLTLPGPGSLKRKGFSFGGWMATSSPGPVLKTFRAGAMDRGNPTLYAAWVRTVSFKSGGGKGVAPSSMTFVAGGNRLVLPSGSSLTRTGFEFAGWSLTPRGKPIKKSAAFLPKSANTVLHAVWRKS
jgi:hypothetical protein